MRRRFLAAAVAAALVIAPMQAPAQAQSSSSGSSAVELLEPLKNPNRPHALASTEEEKDKYHVPIFILFVLGLMALDSLPGWDFGV